MPVPRVVEALRSLLLAPVGWVRRRPRASVYALSLLLHLLLAPFLIHDWDGYVFIQTMHDFLAGQTPYETVQSESPHIYVGDNVPVVNSWYAYPPVPLLLMAPFFALSTTLSAAPWAERMGVKASFILGDLLLAYVAAELVRAALKHEGDAARADRRAGWVEKALLLNPFLVFISAGWGMFDAWILAFFFGAVLLAYKGRPALAGVAFALACLVKPFPALLGPLLLGFVAARLGWRATPRFVGAGLVTGVAVCLPFFLLAPQGFLEEVVFMHAKRPPQGFTLVGIPLAFGWITDLTGIPLPRDVRPETIGQVSFALLAAVAGLLATRMREARSPAALLHLCLATLVGVLLVNKVVNEQYFVLPIGFAAVALAFSERPVHRWLLVAYTAGGMVSAIWLGWHFITMLPVDVAMWLLPVDPLDAVPRIMEFLGWNGEESYIYPTLIGAVALVPAAILSFRLAGRELWTAARGLSGRLPGLRPAPAAPAFLMVALLLVAPLSVGVLAARSEPESLTNAPPLVKEGPLVGTYYYLWWHNPAHDPRVEFGNWRKGVTQVPEEGYYTISAGKIRSDFRQMKASGIDLVVISYHDYDRPKMPAVARLAQENGLLFVPQMELSELYERREHQNVDPQGEPMGPHFGYSLREETRRALVEFASRAISDSISSPAAWRVDGRPVVMWYDSYFAVMDHSPEVRARVTARALELAAADPSLMPEGWTPEALNASYPRIHSDILDGGLYVALWRQAYDDVHRAFWRDIRADLEARHGALYFVGGDTWEVEHGAYRGPGISIGGFQSHDASFVYAPSFAWVYSKEDTFDENHARWYRNHWFKAQHERAMGAPVIVSVSPAYDDRALRKDGFAIPPEHNGTSTYRRMWEDALGLRPDVVLVATWNEFYEGTGIEPTKEHGRVWLDETLEFSRRLKEREPLAEKPVLLVTNLRGASFEPRVPDPDWTYDLSVNLQAAAHELWGPLAEAADWNGPALQRVDLSRYGLVVVEPGPARALDPQSRVLAERLVAYASAGGRVLLLGSVVGPELARLAPWGEGEPFPNATLDLPGGPVAIDANDRARVHHLPPEARTYLWMDNGTARAPAAWTYPQGDGLVAVTAFRPQGVGPVEENNRSALRAALAPLLRTEEG